MLLRGRHEVVLEKEGVKLVPKHGWIRTEAVEVRYLDVVGISIVEARFRERGKFTLRLVDGSDITTTFTSRATLKRKAVQHQAWKRVRAARAAERGTLGQSCKRASAARFVGKRHRGTIGRFLRVGSMSLVDQDDTPGEANRNSEPKPIPTRTSWVTFSAWH